MEVEIRGSKLHYTWRGEKKQRQLHRLYDPLRRIDVLRTAYTLTQAEADAVADALKKQGYKAWISTISGTGAWSVEIATRGRSLLMLGVKTKRSRSAKKVGVKMKRTTKLAEKKVAKTPREVTIRPYGAGAVEIKVALKPSEIPMARRAAKLLEQGELDEKFEQWFKKNILPLIPKEYREDAKEASFWVERGKLIIDTGW